MNRKGIILSCKNNINSLDFLIKKVYNMYKYVYMYKVMCALYNVESLIPYVKGVGKMKLQVVKRFISVIVMLAVLITAVPVTFASDDYSKYADFPTGWSKTAMEHAVDNGLLSGRTPTTINPQDYLTRAEMATIINRVFGATVKADISKYTDVKPGDWYYEEIAKAVNMRTFIGDSVTTMNPNENITREAVFTVIARALVLETDDFSSLNKYPDKDKVSNWARSAASVLVSKGYVNGNNEGNLCPSCYVTREEFAQIMYNIIKTYYVKEGNFSNTGEDSSLIRTSGVTLENVTIDGDIIIGDGVGNGTVTLKNVNINGRLLCRGGEKAIKLINTKVNEYVVVYDVNGTVHFDNYRTESVFKNIKELTPATFLKSVAGGSGSSGGSSGGSSSGTTKKYYTVSFHNGSDPVAFDSVKINQKYSDSNRNLAYLDESLDDIYEDYIAELPSYKRSTLGYNTLGAEYEHQVEKEYIYEEEPGVWSVFTEDTTVSKDIDVYYAAKRAVLEVEIPALGIPYSLELRYDSNSRFVDSMKDALITTGSTLEKDVVKNQINEKISELYSALNTETGLVDAQGNILVKDFGLKIVKVIDYDDIQAEVKTYVENLLVEKMNNGTAEELLSVKDLINLVIPGDVDAIVTHVGGLSEQDRVNLAKDVVNNLAGYSPYDEFMRAFDEERETFEINKTNTHFARAVGNAVSKFKFEEILPKLKDKGFGPVISLLGEDAIEDMFVSAKGEYWEEMEPIVTAVENDNVEKADYTTSLKIKTDIPDILRSIYDQYSSRYIDRIENSGIYDYDKNTSLKKFVNIDWFDLVFGYDQSRKVGNPAVTGYYIRDYMDYYCSLLDVLIIFDDALCFYNTEDYDDEKLVEVKKSLTKEVLYFLEQLSGLSGKIAHGEPIVGNYTLQDLIEKVESLENVADSMGGTSSESQATAIATVVDSVKSMLVELGAGNLPDGSTLDDLTALSEKLQTVIEGINEGDYESINATFEELISASVKRIEDIIKELDENGKITGNVIWDMLSDIPALNNIYNQYIDQFRAIISALADADIGELGAPFDSEKFEDIVFGREEDDIFNVDSVVDFVKAKLGTPEKTGYDDVNKVYIVDQYSKDFGDIGVFFQRKFY